MIFNSYKMDEKDINEYCERRKKINRQISKYREVISFFPFFVNMETGWIRTYITDEYHYCSDLTIIIIDISVEEVIQGLLGPIHRLWNVLWELDDSQIKIGKSVFLFKTKDIQLKGGVFRFYIRVDEGKAQSCKIVKRLSSILTDEELEKYRGNYRYELECNGIKEG